MRPVLGQSGHDRDWVLPMPHVTHCQEAPRWVLSGAREDEGVCARSELRLSVRSFPALSGIVRAPLPVGTRGLGPELGLLFHHLP